MEDSLYHLVGVILQMRFVRVQCVMTTMILLVLLIRGVYRKAKGANPYVYGFLWILPLVAVFAGKWTVFEWGTLGRCEEVMWEFLDEVPMLGATYWGIAVIIWGCYLVGKFRLWYRVRQYPKIKGLAMKERWIQIRISDAWHSPFTCGIMRPRIVLPADYEERYTREELELVLLHERMHIQCYHTFFFGVMAFARAVCWMNPVVYWGVQAFRTDMEVFCDGKVARERDRIRYGKLILKSLLELQEPENVLQQVTFFFSQSECRRRIELLAAQKGGFWKKRKWILCGVVGVVALAMVILLTSSRWVATEYTGIDSILVRESVQEMTWTEISLTTEQCEAVIKNENEFAILIDSKTLRELVRKQGYDGGEVAIWYGGYNLGLGSESENRIGVICSLYDGERRLIRLEKPQVRNQWMLKYL